MITLVDYGMGNLRSVLNAFEAVGEKICLTSDPADLQKASAIVLPGVGAFGDGIKNLQELHLIEVLEEEVLRKKKPYLGICLGMQFLAEESFEGGRHRGFGWIRGAVRRIEPNDKRFKIPHMGWNDLKLERPSELFTGLPEAPIFYFVHGYQLEVGQEDAQAVTATCCHGTTITASVQKENIYGVQFHPEKSQRVGLQLLKNFVTLTHQVEHAGIHSC